MLKVSAASFQTFIDTLDCVLEDRVQYSTVHIPNVFCDGHLQIISCVGIVNVRCKETFFDHPVLLFSKQRDFFDHPVLLFSKQRDFLITLYYCSVNKETFLSPCTTVQ